MSNSSSPRPRAGVLEIQAYVGGKAGESGDAAKLSANENAIGASPNAVEAFKSAASRLHRYPEGSSYDLRHAIGRRHNIDPERIVCGAGSDELISLIAQAYAGPGDEVVYSAHGFLMYKLSSLAAGAIPVAAPEQELTADVDALLAAVTSRTRIVFLANPNNPTGSYLKDSEVRRLRDGLPDDVLLVIDAAYAEFVSAEDYSDGLALALSLPNTVITRTFSKLHGLAALRLGWMVAGADVIDVINRVRGPFNVNIPAQAAGIAAIEDIAFQNQARAHNDRWLPWLREQLHGLGLIAHPSVANFVLIEFPKDENRNAQMAAAFMEAGGVVPRGVGAYGLPHCLRLSVGTEAENRKAIDLIKSFMGGQA